MPLKFPLANAAALPRCPSAANDNPPDLAGQDFGHRVLLRAALQHLVAHGAGAAEIARSNAEHAFFAGKRRDYLHWMAICGALDRRMVDAAAPPLSAVPRSSPRH